MIWVSAGALAAAALVVCGCGLTRAGYETAPYLVTTRESRIEVREYPALTLVSTPMPASADGEGGGFMTLFGYISGENEESEKISMTTPVFMNDTDDGREMSFVIPQDVAARGAPRGTKPSVEIKRMPKGSYVVYRLEGARSDEKIRSAKEALTKWMDLTEHEAAGPFIFAGYDPPFTPSVLQRNEVLVRLQD
jgi:hypothetical protein